MSLSSRVQSYLFTFIPHLILDLVISSTDCLLTAYAIVSVWVSLHYINFHFISCLVISIEIVHSLHHWLELLVIAFMILLHSLLIKFSELFKVILIILSLFLISHETTEESQNISFKSFIIVMLYVVIFSLAVICKGCYQDETIPGRAAVGGHWNMNHET